MRFHGLVTIVASLISTAALAVPLQVDRQTVTTISPGAAGTFAGASFSYDNNILFNANGQNDVLLTNLNAVPASTGITIFGLGSSVASPSSTPDGTPSTLITINTDGSAGSGWGFRYTGAASSVPGDSFLTYTTFGGRYALEFSGGGVNFVDAGGTFHSTVKIGGNFSAAASHTAVTFGAGYSLLQDFVYDSINDITLVDVQTTNYDGTNPGMRFLLLGDDLGRPVPEPAMPALIGAAMLAALVTRRRRAR